MEIQGFFTQKGLALAAKLSAGTPLSITRVAAGSGFTPTAAVQLVQPMQTLAVNTPTRTGTTVTLPATLVPAEAPANYALTELGIYANDPHEGEILYKLYRLDQAVDISPASRMVLRFYLEETLSQTAEINVACAPAGLVTEAVCGPVREMVLTSAVPTEVVEVAASNLQTYLDSLPRLLTKTIEICVRDAVEETVTLSSFYGCGSIKMTGITFRKTLCLQDNAIPIRMLGCVFSPAFTQQYEKALLVQGCVQVSLSNCVIDGTDALEPYGILSDQSRIFIGDTSVSSCWIAIQCSSGSLISLKGGSYSNNLYGAAVQHGDIICLGANVPDTLGSSTNLKQGGLIVSSAGAVI